MPTTPPTIVAPLPHDPRVMTLAKTLGLSRREAFAAVAEAWAWLSVNASDGLVMRSPPDTLDGIVDVAGFGAAMIDTGLVGVVDDGLVLPAELRRLERGESRHRADVDDDQGDDHRRRGDRNRQRRCRARKTLTEPRPQPARRSPVVEPAGPRPQPRPLGSVAGHPVMLLYRRDDGVPFYKLANATPKEFTGSVTDPENPSLEDALTAIHSAMSWEAGKSGVDGETFKPAVSVVAAAAGIDTSVTEATDPAPPAVKAREPLGPRPSRPLCSRAAFKAKAPEVIDAEPAKDAASRPSPPLRSHRVLRRDNDAPASAERDTSVTNVTVTRDTVTVTNPSRPNERDIDSNSNDDRDLQSVTCHGPVTRDTPSSISSSSSLSGEREEEEKGRETESSTIIPGSAGDALKHQSTRRQLERFERFAEALGIDIEVVEWRSRHAPDELFEQLKRAGIDIRTGLPVNADASGKSPQARQATSMTTEPGEGDKPAEGILVAPAAVDLKCDDDETATTDTSPGRVAGLAQALG